MNICHQQYDLCIICDFCEAFSVLVYVLEDGRHLVKRLSATNGEVWIINNMVLPNKLPFIG